MTSVNQARAFRASEDRYYIKSLLDVGGELVVEWHCQLHMSDPPDFYRFCGSKP
jgi:hypothetical protein